jgi:3-hydroxy-9,10-secoandrosta-1,3,5(10)-triene-9,17-dione monooxygenase reductase component
MPPREPEPSAANAGGNAERIPPDAFRDAMAHMPTGVTVVTAFGPEGPSGLTANAVSSLSLDPPLMLACLDRGSRTLRAVEHAGRFGVNVLAAEQADVARSFGTKLEMHEKWEGIAWRERNAIPSLEGTVAWVGCELRDVLAGGDHVIVTGRVLDVASGNGDPLVFYRGSYMGLGEAP